jgi:PRTRC genetic system protein E
MTDTPNPFQSLAACLGEGERLRLELHREGEALAVLVQPVLKAAPPGLDTERQRMRAALAYPLRLTGTAAQLDRELVAALVAYGAKRQEVRAAASDLDALDEALRHARQATHARRQQAAQVANNAPPAETKPVPVDVDDAPPAPAASAARLAVPPARKSDSLF